MSKYILWNPKSNKPPKRVFRTLEAAMDCAKWAAGKSPGERFHVCELVDSASVGGDVPDEESAITEPDYSYHGDNN